MAQFANDQSAATAKRSISDRLSHGGWYYAVTVFTGGFLAAVPFWHAARRLNRRAVTRLALVYTGLGVLLTVLMALTPPPNPDGTSGNPTISTIGGMAVVAVVIIGCLQLRGLRREVFGERVAASTRAHPAVAQALAARQRRAEARQLRASDPALARQLGIGRPDLRRDYDDGGLVDLNTAPASVVAQVCDIEVTHAEAVVSARPVGGGSYLNLSDLFVDVNLPPHVQDQLREHAII
jgi:hypothetical protein